MNEEQKTKVQEIVGKAADELSDKALAEARKQTNKLWKVLLYCVAVAMAGIAALAGFTGCESVPRVELTVEQVQAAETVYTALGGEVKYRVIPVDSVKAD